MAELTPDDTEAGADFEGPFLTLADFMRAQEIRDRLHRRKKISDSVAVGEKIQTFDLTTTHHEEAERPVSRASDEYSFTSKSNASLATTQYAPKKTYNKNVQTLPPVCDQDPELLLRRYYFKIDWSKHTSVLETATKCKDNFQHFREGLNELVSRRRAAADALAESKRLEAGKVADPMDNIPQKYNTNLKKKKQVQTPTTAEKAGRRAESDDSIRSSTNINKVLSDAKVSGSKKTEALYNEVPSGSLCYYEVKYCIENSTILPEMLAVWLTNAEPRNQDDVFPLLVLCKDLLRKFCLRETTYAFKREEYLEKQINTLQKELDESTAQRNDEREKYSTQKEEHLSEIKELRELLSSTQTDFSIAKARIEGLELGKKLLLQLISELQPQCESQVSELSQQLSAIRDLEQVVSIMDSAFREIKHEAQITKTGAQAQSERLHAEIVRLSVANRLGNERITLLEDALKTSNHLNDEFMGHFNALMSRKPEEVLESMTFEQKTQFLKILIGDPENLLMHVEVSDLSALSIHCLRFASCLFLGGIRAKSSNHSAWLDTISESLGCTPDMLVFTILTAMKVDGRPAILSSCDSTSVIWTFISREMSISDVEIDFASFDKLNAGGQDLVLKMVSSDDVENDGDSLSSFKDEAKVDSLSTGAEERTTPQMVPSMDGGAVQYVYRTVEVRREEEYNVKKYGLFNMKVVKGVENYTIEEMMGMFGAILDFKAESDYLCDMSIRPRSNMVKCIRLYLNQKFKHFEDTEKAVKRFCKSVLYFRNQHPLLRVFGTISGMTDTTHWSERSACFLLELLKAVKRLDEPGEESKDPDTMAEGWNVYRTWISDPERTVEKTHFVQGLADACETMFGFGPMAADTLEQALNRCAAPTLNTSNQLIQPVKLHNAISAAMTMWFAQLDSSRAKLKELFVRNDVNGDGVLEMDEFIHLIKSTGYKMRQHDAMNMFHELAGPDDTVDQDEFSELVVFMKFNVRAILAESSRNEMSAPDDLPPAPAIVNVP